MSKDTHFRRMAINKFNNRPPFNLKKSDGSTSTGDHEQHIVTPPSSDFHDPQFLNSADKSYRSVLQYLEQIDDTYQKSMKNKNKNIIPKVIESFQKVTPKKRSKVIRHRQKSDSLHTLYRNNNPNFGKNIPNHKLMKKLLKNFDTENTEISSYQNVDIIPSRDTNRSVQDNAMKNFSEINLTVRVDKKTSTTGLQWPIVTEPENSFQVNLKPSAMNISNRNIGTNKTRIPKISADKFETDMNKSSKFISRNQLRYSTESKKSVCSSELEYFPTKEVSHLQPKKADYISKIPTKQNVHIVTGLNKLNLNKEFPKYKFNSRQDDSRKDYSHMQSGERNRDTNEDKEGKKKEKSFVQLQVEKYNKINSKKNMHTKGHLSNKSLKKNFQESRKNINKNYLNIMTSMRENLPKLGEELAADSAGESHEWSDNTTIIEDEVKFPKETRNAMEHIMKNMTRIPLAKCTKNQNLQLQPAISINRVEYKESRETPSAISYKKINQLPCSNNLLCDRGNHDGPCARMDKGNPPRYNNKSIRPKYKTYVVK